MAANAVTLGVTSYAHRQAGSCSPRQTPRRLGLSHVPGGTRSKTITEWVRRGHVKVYSDEQVNLMDVLVRVGER